MRRIVVIAMLASLVASVIAIPATSVAADCQFVHGFKLIKDQIPDVVGDCTENEHHNPENGDGLQATTGGLLVWRKADNWTAFTDGYRTWINGPLGLQRRLNTERFPWEGDYARNFALTLADLPAGFSEVRETTGPASNEVAAKSWQDPAAALARFQQWGRVSGYIADYQVPGLGALLGIARIRNDISIFQTPQGAQAAFAYAQQTAEGWERVSAPRFGDESMALKQVLSTSQNGQQFEWTVFVIQFRKGTTYVSVVTLGLTATANFQTVVDLARKVESRIP